MNHLVDIHGPQILKDFDDLFTRHFWNLTNVAKKYGFSREWARQIFKRLYGHGYQAIKKKKAQKRRDGNVDCQMDWHVRLMPLLRRCQELGLEVKRFNESLYDLVINDYVVRFGSCTAQMIGNKYTRTLYYAVRPFCHRDKSDCDFVICHVEDCFYVIPVKDAPLTLYFRKDEYKDCAQSRLMRRPDRFSGYREAWHLLDKSRVEKESLYE